MTSIERPRLPTARFLHPPGSRVSRDRQRLRVIREGKFHAPWEDAYHLVLTVPWGAFLAAIVVLYCLTNVAFACLYLLDPGGIENAQPHSFTDAFFFSVQTIATVGYGAMYPKTLLTQSIATVETLAGLLGISMATGLMFARFSRPTARVLFSRVVTLSTHNGVPTLTFRMANQRANQIVEAQVQVAFVEDELTAEGMPLRRLQNLTLTRSESPMFALSWMVMHPIGPDSPLYGRSLDSLADTDAMLVVSLAGIDETLSQTIHARHIYVLSDFVENHRFVDIVSRAPDGSVHVNYRNFHKVLPGDA